MRQDLGLRFMRSTPYATGRDGAVGCGWQVGRVDAVGDEDDGPPPSLISFHHACTGTTTRGCAQPTCRAPLEQPTACVPL